MDRLWCHYHRAASADSGIYRAICFQVELLYPYRSIIGSNDQSARFGLFQ